MNSDCYTVRIPGVDHDDGKGNEFSDNNHKPRARVDAVDQWCRHRQIILCVEKTVLLPIYPCVGEVLTWDDLTEVYIEETWKLRVVVVYECICCLQAYQRRSDVETREESTYHEDENWDK